MKKSLNTSNQSQDKSKQFNAQFIRVYEAFKQGSSTMLMVSVKTGILRANICRYVAQMEKNGIIKLVKNELCNVSKFRAGYYTTDENLFPEDNQYKLFNND